MKNILITGGNGQLGKACRKRLADLNKVGNLYNILSTDIQEIDITNIDSIIKFLETNNFKPDFVINCAAYTAVDRAEYEIDTAYDLNVVGVSNLVKLCSGEVCNNKFKSKLIHISTDYVFDGKSKNIPDAWLESNIPNPGTVYGRTKLDGENAIMFNPTMMFDSGIILRTAWLYSPNGHNFLKTILKLALNDDDKNKIRKIVNDQFGCPTSASELAKQIVYVIENFDQLDKGVYHAVCSGYTSWYNFAIRFLELMNVDSSNFKPCLSEEFPTPAKRPHNSILSTEKLADKNAYVMVDWETALQNFVLQFGNDILKEALVDNNA